MDLPKRWRSRKKNGAKLLIRKIFWGHRKKNMADRIVTVRRTPAIDSLVRSSILDQVNRLPPDLHDTRPCPMISDLNERIVRFDYTADRLTQEPEMQAPAQHTLSANEAKTHFGELLDLAQRGPVRVTRRNRVVGVMVSAADFEAMRAFYADRLLGTMHRAAKDAGEKGLSPAVLDQLLADES